MDRHYYIKLIVEQMFNKIRLTSTADSVTGWTNDIEIQSDPKNRISYKTAERAHKKYIENDDSIGKFEKQSIDNFCKFIGYDDYKNFVENKIKNEPKAEERKNEKTTNATKIGAAGQEEAGRKERKWILTLKITVAFVFTIILYQLVNPIIWKNKNDNNLPIDCMAWAEDHYEKVDCDLQLHPIYGTKVESYKSYLEKSMQKLDNDTIDASTTFFSEETGNPLVWYYKTKEGTLEYFTAPGLHPVNGKTLKKITEGIIETYVPIHTTKPDSFMSSDTTNSIKADIAILVLDGNDFDDQIASDLKGNYFNKNNSVLRLNDIVTYQKSFIYNFNPDKKLYLDHQLIIADTLVLGLSKYHFSNDLDIENMVTCNLLFELSLYTQSDNKWKEITSKTINTIGSGYTKIEAKTNAINKINYE